MTNRFLPRRQFIKAVGAAGLSTCFSSSLAAAGKRKTAIVLGAGIAGLSAAFELQRAGFQVTVLERGDQAGGRAKVIRKGPLTVASIASAVFGANSEMFDLARQLGIEEQMRGPEISIPVENGRGTYRIGMRFLPEEIAAIPGLSEGTRAQLPRLQEDLQEIAKNVDPCLIGTGAAYDTESVWDYYVRRVGKQAAQEIVDYWVAPIYVSAWGTPVEEGSCITMLGWFARQDAKFMVPSGGLALFSKTLATRLDVQLNTVVRCVSAPDRTGRRTVHYLTPAGTTAQITPDVVVCALPGKYVHSVIEDLDEHYRPMFERLDFTKYASVTYVLRDEFAPSVATGERYIPNHPDPMKRRLNSWDATPRRGDRPPTVSISLSQTEIAAWQEMGSPLHKYAFRLLQKFYPSLKWDQVADQVVQGGDGTPYLNVGFAKAAQSFLEHQKRSRSSLYFAGEYLGHAHVGGTCASGRTVGRLIGEHWV